MDTFLSTARAAVSCSVGMAKILRGPWTLSAQAAGTLKTLLSLILPPVIDFRRMFQGLHYHTILFGFLLQGAQLLCSGLRCADVENDSDALKSDSRFFGNSQGSLQVQVTFDRDVYALGGYAHGSRHHLAGDLGAGGDCAQ